MTWKRELVAAGEEVEELLLVPRDALEARRGGGEYNAPGVKLEGEVVQAEIIIHENPLQDDPDQEAHRPEEEEEDGQGEEGDEEHQGSPIECSSNLMVTSEPRHTI